ncbi:MAG: 30S ribosomal protein S4 [Candidatus Pacebacteria bacterium]|nr:30S ribosomal protein S4 [Candidatus Paceibacterota bacterium]
MHSKPTYKVCRRLGAGVFDKCQTQKFVLSEAKHARFVKNARRRTTSDFSKQLIEKQRVRFAYGVTERQLSRYVEESHRVSILGVDPAKRMLEQFEMRLDNIIYRVGLAASRRAARQLVSHGHVLVGGVRTTIPSRQMKEGDVFSVRERTRGLPIMTHIQQTLDSATAPRWLSFDGKKLEGKVIARPNTDTTEMPGSVSAILEYYSR